MARDESTTHIVARTVEGVVEADMLAVDRRLIDVLSSSPSPSSSPPPLHSRRHLPRKFQLESAVFRAAALSLSFPRHPPPSSVPTLPGPTMPRPSTRSTRLIDHRPPPSPPPPSTPALEEEACLANLTLLRRNWKWAVFSQFYFTFAQLFAMDDVPISVSKSNAYYFLLPNPQSPILPLGHRGRPRSLHSRAHLTRHA